MAPATIPYPDVDINPVINNGNIMTVIVIVWFRSLSPPAINQVYKYNGTAVNIGTAKKSSIVKLFQF